MATPKSQPRPAGVARTPSDGSPQLRSYTRCSPRVKLSAEASRSTTPAIETVWRTSLGGAKRLWTSSAVEPVSLKRRIRPSAKSSPPMGETEPSTTPSGISDVKLSEARAIERSTNSTRTRRSRQRCAKCAARARCPRNRLASARARAASFHRAERSGRWVVRRAHVPRAYGDPGARRRPSAGGAQPDDPRLRRDHRPVARADGDRDAVALAAAQPQAGATGPACATSKRIVFARTQRVRAFFAADTDVPPVDPTNMRRWAPAVAAVVAFAGVAGWGALAVVGRRSATTSPTDAAQPVSASVTPVETTVPGSTTTIVQRPLPREFVKGATGDD